MSGLQRWPRWVNRSLVLLAGLVLLSWSMGCRSPQPNPAGPSAQGLPPSRAQVVEVRGSGVRARTPWSLWQRVQPGEWLPMGASVRTAGDSSVILRLPAAGAGVEVKPNSQLRLLTLTSRTNGTMIVSRTQLSLEQGEVIVDNSKLTPGSEFEVRTPRGITRIPPP